MLQCAISTAMPAPFRDRLRSSPVVLEVVPPSRRASDKSIAGFVQRVREAARSIPDLDAVNVPEVLDENHEGQPFYRNLDPRDFVTRLGADLGVDPIVNKVVAHLPSAAALRRWVDESSSDFAVRSFVLVGGTSGRIRYPGPSVVEANRVLRAALRGRADVALGNITIPERESEIDRLMEKTQAGCDFFTSQVLFEAEPMATVLRAYGRRCAAQGIEPATFLLSFAPVSDYQDIEFLVWLGATVTPRTEEALLASVEPGSGRPSFDRARTLWSQLRAAAGLSRPPVPLGVNVEMISTHNFDLAVQMAREFCAARNGSGARAGDV